MLRHIAAALALMLLAAAGGGRGGAAAATRGEGPQSGALTVFLKVDPVGKGTTVSVPAGIDCGPRTTACQAGFPQGTRVTLTASGDLGWAWHHWDLACASAQNNTCALTLNASFTEAAVVFFGANYSPPAVKATWSRSVLSGTFTVAGSTSHQAEIKFTLVSPDAKKKVDYSASVPAPGGSFTKTFPLPKAATPGKYTLAVVSFVAGKFAPEQFFFVNIPAPKEGVVSKAWISAFGGSAPVARLPASAIGATAHFVFAANPFKGSAVTTTWFRNNKKFFGPVGKPRTKNVTSFVGVRGGHLPRGFYTCVLKARGLVVKQVGIQVG